MKKKCTKCKIDKLLEDYSFKNIKTGYLHAKCKTCSNELSKKLYDESINRRNSIKKSRKNNIKRNQIFVNRYKELIGCTECKNPKFKKYYFLDFHHIDDTKEKNVSLFVKDGNSIKSIKDEIRKCILICSNCHRELHHKMKYG